MRLVLVRHGETDWNLNRRIQGATDIPLNATGRRQAAEAGARLAGRRWDAIYASPLSRAHETARIMAGELGLDAPLLLPDLTERRHGEIEGMTLQERALRFPAGASVPGLEPREDVVARVMPSLLRLAPERPNGTIIVVSHGGVIGSLVRHLTAGERPGDGEVIVNGSAHDFVVRAGELLLDVFRPGDPAAFAATG